MVDPGGDGLGGGRKHGSNDGIRPGSVTCMQAGGGVRRGERVW